MTPKLWVALHGDDTVHPPEQTKGVHDFPVERHPLVTQSPNVDPGLSRQLPPQELIT
jgi:hypothetical protein